MWLTLRIIFVAYYQRLSRRAYAARQGSITSGEGGREVQRTLIVGAGRAGAALCQELRTNLQLQCEVVGFVDDALEKQGVRIQGIPVLGHSQLLPVFLKERHATQVILAMPRASGARLKELTEMLQAEGVRVKTVPGIFNLIGDRPWKPELRDISIEDLLRREPVCLYFCVFCHDVVFSLVLIRVSVFSIGM